MGQRLSEHCLKKLQNGRFNHKTHDAELKRLEEGKMQLHLIRQQSNHHKHQPVQSATCVVSNLEIHSKHPSDDDQHKLKYSSSNLEILCHYHRPDDYRDNLAIALNIKLYTLISFSPQTHHHLDDQHNLMGQTP